MRFRKPLLVCPVPRASIRTLYIMGSLAAVGGTSRYERPQLCASHALELTFHLGGDIFLIGHISRMCGMYIHVSSSLFPSFFFFSEEATI